MGRGVKLRRGYFRFPDFWSIPLKENCHNSRTSDDIDMKLAPVTKLDKRNKTTSKKKLTLTPNWKIVTLLSFFGFLTNLEQSRGRISDTESAKVIFFSNCNLLPFRTKNYLTQLSHYYFE